MTDTSTLRALEAEIAHGLSNSVPVRTAPPPPDDIGRLTAEAVLKQYDTTAKQVEELGQTVREWIAKMEMVLKDCDEDLKLIGEASKAVREKGDAIHALIEQATSTSRIIRDTCSDFVKKVAV